MLLRLRRRHLGGWMGGVGLSFEPFHCSGLGRSLSSCAGWRLPGNGNRGFRVPTSPRSPKSDVVSSPLCQRPLCVVPVVYRLWATVRLSHIQAWFFWFPSYSVDSKLALHHSVFSSRSVVVFPLAPQERILQLKSLFEDVLCVTIQKRHAEIVRLEVATEYTFVFAKRGLLR